MKFSFFTYFIFSLSIFLSSIIHAEEKSKEIDHSQHNMNYKEMNHDDMDHSQHMNMKAENQQGEKKKEEIDHSQHIMHGNDHGAINHHGHHKMTLDDEGMVMNSNDSELPIDCPTISREYDITVKASIKYSYEFPGTIFGFDQHEIKVEPCSKLNITFINEDEIRHQWMMHGLPKYIYDQGMFHLEAAGGAQKTGTIIVPSDDKTYLIHCDIAQHMEKGMKAQLVVGKGSGNLPSIPGVSGAWEKPN